MKTSVFSRVRSTSENLNVFITRAENIYGFHWKKSKFSFYFIVYTPMCAFDVINYIAKLNMNVMALMFSQHLKRWRDKNKKSFVKSVILLPKCSLHSN